MREIERSVARLAAAQHGVVGRGQALRLGMSESAIRTKLANGLWKIAEPGVYVVVGARPTWEQRVFVALVACGERSAASHVAAGHVHGFIEDSPSTIDVTVPRGRHPRSKRGRRVHRPHDLRPEDLTRVSGIVVTSVPRTLLDLSGVLPDIELEAALDRALVSGRTSIDAMRRYLKASGRTRDVRRLTRLLDDRELGVPESELERAFERLLKRHKLPMPVRQAPVSRFRVDYMYPELNVVIEVDGSATRSTKAQLQKDRRRQNEIVLVRNAPLRFTWDDVVKDPGYVVATIRRAIGAGGGS